MTTDLFTADFSTLKGTDLYNAIANFTRANEPPDDRTPENYTVDFKEQWGDKALRVIAGFANTFGGIIIIGVSEDRGKAKDIVGETAKSELQTRLAASISANITPTPSYDITECELPGSPDRRLCVVRVRASTRIHFLTKKNESPVYIRNADQAIPAPAAELRNLIDRERNSGSGNLASVVEQTTAATFQLLLVQSPPQDHFGFEGPFANDSVTKIAVVPEQRDQLSFDYNLESMFEEIARATFPPVSFAEDQTWNSDKTTTRKNSYFRVDWTHLGRGIQSKWLFTSTRDFGFATRFTNNLRENQRRWSLPDLATELISSIRTAQSMMDRTGYFGDAQIRVLVVPGAGMLLVEQAKLPFLRLASVPSPAWPRDVVPSIPRDQAGQNVEALVNSSFYSRTEDISSLVGNLLNQILRDLQYGADLALLKQWVTVLAKDLKDFNSSSKKTPAFA